MPECYHGCDMKQGRVKKVSESDWGHRDKEVQKTCLKRWQLNSKACEEGGSKKTLLKASLKLPEPLSTMSLACL